MSLVEWAHRLSRDAVTDREPMPAPVTGIHHVTAICGGPQLNIDFYVVTLGLRLVKRTVNFDDPGTYHLYYGDQDGRPGTLLTFFPWPGAAIGRHGAAMVGATAFAAPPGSVDFWIERLKHVEYEYFEPIERFGERVLPLHDPDGLRLEIIERAEAAAEPGWKSRFVDLDCALRTFHSVTLHPHSFEGTVSVLADALGFEEVGQEEGRLRFRSPDGVHANIVDLVAEQERGRQSAGTVHHVAFRARDDEHQAELREHLQEMGLRVTGVRDRQYFRSIYFREPGGILFEIATDGPGMAVDEEPERLGGKLKLPPALEPRRTEIERRLPEIAIPA